MNVRRNLVHYDDYDGLLKAGLDYVVDPQPESETGIKTQVYFLPGPQSIEHLKALLS